MTPPPHEPATITLLLRAAELLHTYGTPAHRLERVVVHLAAHFGLTVQVFSQPTSLFIGFEEGAPERVRLLRVEPGGVDLGKLVDVDELLEEVEAGRVAPEEALVRLDELEAHPPRWSGFASVLGHGLAAGSAAVFFGGRVADALLSAVLGVLIGLLERVAQRREGVAGIYEPLAAFLAAAVGVAAARVGAGAIDDRIVALASVIVLVPGLSLTVALIELATRHLASGTARLTGALSVFLTIAFGAYLGRAVVEGFIGPGQVGAPAAPEALLSSPVALVATVALASLGFGLLFGARARELPWVFGSSATGFAVARLVTELATQSGAEDPTVAVKAAAIASFAGALAVGTFANFYARFRNRPATVPLLPGLLVLVPGAVGYRALSAFAEQNAVTGIETAFQMLLVAAALVGGLLTANVVLPPRRVL
ncbi:MAG: threonine/serine exporter family protein [Planctomycetota bacterium]